MGIAGVDTMNDAEALAGRELRVPVESAGAAAARHVLPARPDRLPGRDARRGTWSGTVEDVEGTLNGSRLVVGGAARRGADSARLGDLHHDRPGGEADRDRSAGGAARSELGNRVIG